VGESEMKVFYSKQWDMYVPSEEHCQDPPGDWVEREISEEVIDCEGGADDPYRHGEVWETEFQSEDWMHMMGTKIPWKFGKYRIIIREVKE